VRRRRHARKSAWPAASLTGGSRQSDSRGPVAQVSDGSIRGIEEVSRYSTSDFGYVVQIERRQARFNESGDISPISLRATMIFRREGCTWRIVHRHADAITTPRPAGTVIEA
jgi:hypothetical protein